VTAPTQAKRSIKSLREFRETTATLFAKNNTPHKVTCNTPDGNVQFELDPAGYENSIMIMPKECLSVPGFQRMWMRGAITISDDEAMENEIQLLMGGQVEIIERPIPVMNEDGTWGEIKPELQAPPEQKDIIMRVDNDPNSRTYGQASTPTCIVGGEPIFQNALQLRNGEPPLCPLHVSEAPRVVSTPQPDGTWTHRLGNQPVIEPKRTINE
jgi:hypothetical protein